MENCKKKVWAPSLDTPPVLNHSRPRVKSPPGLPGAAFRKDRTMPIDDIPQPPKPESMLPEFKLTELPLKYEGESSYPIRKATVADVRGILQLINGFASANIMLPRGPRNLFENIRDFVVAADPASEGEEYPHIIACGALHVLWENIAEVRSLAIHPDYQNQGLGRKLVDFMKKEAVDLGVKRLYTFTLAEEFFRQIGFLPKEKEDLPAKLWDECSRCPKYFKCDEVGMVLDL